MPIYKESSNIRITAPGKDPEVVRVEGRGEIINEPEDFILMPERKLMTPEEAEFYVKNIPNLYDTLVKQGVGQKYMHPMMDLFLTKRGGDLAGLIVFPEENIGVYLIQRGHTTPWAHDSQVGENFQIRVGIVRNGIDYGLERLDPSIKMDRRSASLKDAIILNESVRVTIKNAQKKLEEIIIRTE